MRDLFLVTLVKGFLLSFLNGNILPNHLGTYVTPKARRDVQPVRTNQFLKFSELLEPVVNNISA